VAAGDTARGAASAEELSALLAELAASPPAAPPPPWERALAPGRRVGRFELVRELGRGGFGVVFEARDVELGRTVAFKAVRPSARGRDPDTLRREARAVAALQHPAIVTLHDAGRSEEGDWLIFELLRGETLGERLARGPLPPREAVRVGLAVARALVHAHAAGVLHRDLKPSNVFLTADGGVKVLDFGLAHVFGVATPALSGTPGYMAPEQLRGDREDARTDVYALGVILAEMLGPRPPRAAAPLALLAGRCRAAEPAARPDGAAEVARELEAARTRLEAPGAPAAQVPAPARATEALRQLFLAEQWQARPLFGLDSAEHFRRAVALDPTLAAAHYQLAVWTRMSGGPLAAQRRAIARALRHHRGAPPAEQVLIRAFAASVEGRDDDAVALLREATERWPEDPRAHYEIGDLLRHRDELALALPYLERAAALDPDLGWAHAEIAELLGALERTDALRAWMTRWEASPNPVTLHALSLALGWLGDPAGAAAAARRGLALGSGLVGQQDLVSAVGFQGGYEAAAELARGFSEPGSPVRRLGFYTLCALDAYRGRRRAGLAWLDALTRELPEAREDALYLSTRIDYLVGDGALAPILAEVDALERLDPRAAATHAPALAWLGARERSAELARRLRPGSVLARAHAAIAAFRAGAVERALADLAALAAEAPICAWRPSPLWYWGDLAAEAGRPDEAARALERLERQYVPRFLWRTWAHPRALLLLAEARADRGDGAGARAALDRLLREWAGAEREAPLLVAARALSDRVT
jgi:serine/threonine protein kinase